MIYFVVLTSLFILFCAACTSFLALKYFSMLEETNKRDLFLKKIINAVNSVRYGNLHERTEDGYNTETKELSSGLNDLFESFSDREKMIQEYIEKENEANILKADFMAALTHDLKVPIIAQDNTFELFLNKKFGEITTIQEEALRKLKISNIDLKHLVDALLETYKMEQAKVQIKKTKNIEIENLVKEVIKQMDGICELHDKQIRFKNELQGKTADIDVFLIKRVFQNLILNALSHSIHSQIIDIILKEHDKNSFAVAIQDYGCGIDKEEIKKIFKKYYSGSTKFGKSGVGLGLYLSNRIVKLHGGSIEVKSKENKGSIFTVILNYE